MHPADVQPDTAVQTIPLDRLEVSPSNVRKTDPGLQALAELKASIAAHGLLSNLVVRPIPADAHRFAVVAGARRFAALRDLSVEGQIPPDMPVPCRLVSADAHETEISLAENVIRVAMHPADQVEAFAVLAGAGATVSSIAARFGVAERTVEQRLRLGNAAPALLRAYRDDEIDLESLKAFSVTTDHARQDAVWGTLSQQGFRPSAWQIKRMLTENRVPAHASIARFVGVQAYEAAGGHLDRDLFSSNDEDGVWFEDPALLTKLASERLQAAADELLTAWKWAEPVIETDWTALAAFGRVYAIPAQATPEETAETETLQKRQAEMAELDEDEWTEEIAIEAETIEQRLDEIERQVENRSTYTPEDMAIAGCVVTISDDGGIRLVSGLVRREDIPAPAADDKTATADPGAQTTGTRPVIAPPQMSMPNRTDDRAAQARKDAGVGIGLSDDLRSIRTALVKVDLANDFNAAFDLFLFQAARSVFTPGYIQTALEITVRETPDRPTLRMNDETFAAESPGEALLADRSALPFDWMDHDDDADAFAALRALAPAKKKKLFAACIARSVKGQLSFEPGALPELEATVARLDVDFAAKVRPSADIFWGRINKAAALDIARSTLGIEWASGHTKDKKPILAAAMERAFGTAEDVPAGITPEGRSAALAWVPPGFAPFDTTSATTEELSPSPDEQAVTTAPVDTDTKNEPAGAADPIPGPDPVPVPDTDPTAAPTEEPEFREPDPTDAAEPDTVDDDTAPADPGFTVDRNAVHAPQHAHNGNGAAFAAAPANGHDIPADAFEIPEFLRRT